MPKSPSTPAPDKGRSSRRAPAPSNPVGPAPYHHGDLRAGLLAAAERILVGDGIQGLTLRAAAREAGVSHAAPKNHFGDLTGLLSELAAVGFERFGEAMRTALTNARETDRMGAIGSVYVRFARDNPGLFLLMFRGERLDFSRPSLAAASAAALDQLAGTARGLAPERKMVEPEAQWSVQQAVQVVSAWAFVHGLAMLSIDGRLTAIVERLPAGTTEADLLDAIRRGAF